MFDSQDKTLLWCEIHVHSILLTKVLLRKIIDNPGFSLANWYLVEPLLGLQLYAISPPQGEHFGINTNNYGIACIATTFKSHRDSDHSHGPGEWESGALLPATSGRKGKYLDDIFFHGEVMSLDTLNFYGSPIWLMECKMDFGNNGQLRLPIYVPSMQWDNLTIQEPPKKGEYVQGIGSLQLFQI